MLDIIQVKLGVIIGMKELKEVCNVLVCICGEECKWIELPKGRSILGQFVDVTNCQTVQSNKKIICYMCRRSYRVGAPSKEYKVSSYNNSFADFEADSYEECQRFLDELKTNGWREDTKETINLEFIGYPPRKDLFTIEKKLSSNKIEIMNYDRYILLKP